MTPIQLLLPHFKKQRRLFMVGVACLLATNVLHQLLPLLLKESIDSLQGAAAFAAAGLWAGLRFLAVAAQALTRYGWRQGFFGTSRRMETGLRSDLFSRLLVLPPLFYARRKMGDLLSRAISDLGQLREALGFGGMALLDSITMISFTGLAMMRLDPGLTGLSLLPMALLPPLVIWLGRKVRERSRAAQDSLDQLSSASNESFRGARVLHAYAREEAESLRFDKALNHNVEANLRLNRVEALYWPLMIFFTGLSEILLFYYGGKAVVEGRLTLGGFAALNDYLLTLTWPVMAIGFTANLYVRGKVSLERLGDVFQAKEALQGPESAVPGKPQGMLAWKGVEFSHEGAASKALDGFELELKEGEWLGLAGRTGAGKSTALGLMVRAYDPSKGALYLQGMDLRAWPLPELRAQLGFVEQEPFLFSDTVLHNIALGDSKPSLEEAIRCARIADLHEFLIGLPQGYQSLLGEKGVNLSGGQKSRLALARALYRKPRVLLLDDAFSSLDTATEERIVGALKVAFFGVSVVLVSHRLSTLMLCQRVAVVDQGRVSELGPPRDLLQSEGFLFEMSRREQLARKAGLEA